MSLRDKRLEDQIKQQLLIGGSIQSLANYYSISVATVQRFAEEVLAEKALKSDYLKVINRYL